MRYTGGGTYMRHAITLLFGASIALGTFPPSASAQTAPACDATSIDSPPGKIWWAEQRWRYASDAAATDAYKQLVTGQSPWPSWFAPAIPALVQSTPPVGGPPLDAPPLALLPVGTRFQMAMSPVPGPGEENDWTKQKDDQPGGWGTFDNIADVEDVREYLAVATGFKAQIDRVVIYEVTRPLPVRIGPVGPQVDAGTCTYLPGRWSQFNLLAAREKRMDYLRIVEVRPIK